MSPLSCSNSACNKKPRSVRGKLNSLVVRQMSQYSPNASHIEQADLLQEVLRRLATCMQAGSLERAELVARLMKLLERVGDDAGLAISPESGGQ